MFSDFLAFFGVFAAYLGRVGMAPESPRRPLKMRALISPKEDKNGSSVHMSVKYHGAFSLTNLAAPGR